MSGHPLLTPLTPGQIRAALKTHLAKKLGWCGRTAEHVLGELSNDEIARCLRTDPAETRAALDARAGQAMARAAALRSEAA